MRFELTACDKVLFELDENNDIGDGHRYHAGQCSSVHGEQSVARHGLQVLQGSDQFRHVLALVLQLSQSEFQFLQVSVEIVHFENELAQNTEVNHGVEDVSDDCDQKGMQLHSRGSEGQAKSKKQCEDPKYLTRKKGWLDVNCQSSFTYPTNIIVKTGAFMTDWNFLTKAICFQPHCSMPDKGIFDKH